MHKIRCEEMASPVVHIHLKEDKNDLPKYLIIINIPYFCISFFSALSNPFKIFYFIRILLYKFVIRFHETFL
jgi:hypothetical protein